MPLKMPSRQVLWLAALVVVLILVLAYQFSDRGGPAPVGRRAAVRVDPSREAAARDHAESVPDVRLAALKAPRSAPEDNGRNLFREKPAAPPPQPVVAAPQPSPPDPNAPPPPPPPPQPITLKLIGILRGAGKAVAALTDGKDVFYGREGDVVEGRYRIVKINVESIDISYVDGRGQRRLSLAG